MGRSRHGRKDTHPTDPAINPDELDAIAGTCRGYCVDNDSGRSGDGVADERLDRRQVVRQQLVALGAIEQVGQSSGSVGRIPVAASTASGNLAGWAVDRHTIGRSGSIWPAARSAGRRRCRPPCAGRPGSRARMDVADDLSVSSSSSAAAAKPGHAEPRPRRGPGTASSARRAAAVAAEQLEQQPLVVGRHLDVHGRAEVGTTGSATSAPVGDPAGEDVVAVDADDQPVDRARPSARRIQPAKMLPKLPVGTANATHVAAAARRAVT